MDPADMVKKITHLNQALSKCRYPEWTFKKVKSKTTKKDQPVTKTSITIPYIKSLSEALCHIGPHALSPWYSNYSEEVAYTP